MSDIPSEKKWNILVPLSIVVFFIVLFLVDAVIVYIATKTYPGATDDAYYTGLKYNRNIIAYEKQSKLNYHTKISYRNGVLTFSIKDRDGVSLNAKASSVIVFIERPATSRFDKKVVLKFDKKSQEHYLALPLATGRWKIKVICKFNHIDYQTHDYLLVR